MKKKLLNVFAFILALGIFSAAYAKAPAPAAGETTLTITHDLGKATVPLKPKKVVVFDMGALDIINELGTDAEVIAPGDYVTSYLSKYKSKVNIGGLREPNLEGLYMYKPDVIFISGRQQSFYAELSKIAPTVVYIQPEPARYFSELEKSVANIGKILGREAAAQKKIGEIRKQLADTKKAASSFKGNALILLTNDGSMRAYGKGSRFGLIHDVIGIKAADENIKVSRHGQEIGYEYIAKTNPDIIFVVDRTAVVGGSKFASKTLDNAMVNSTKAAKNKKVITMDAEAWYLTAGGLTATRKMLDDVAKGVKK